MVNVDDDGDPVHMCLVCSWKRSEMIRRKWIAEAKSNKEAVDEICSQLGL